MHCTAFAKHPHDFFLHDCSRSERGLMIYYHFLFCVFRDTPMLTAGLGRPFAFTGGTLMRMMLVWG